MTAGHRAAGHRAAGHRAEVPPQQPAKADVETPVTTLLGYMLQLEDTATAWPLIFTQLDVALVDS